MLEVMRRFFQPAADGSGRDALPHWKVAAYSLLVLLALYVGIAMEKRLSFTSFREVLGTIPVLICSAFVLRLPAPAPLRVFWVWRVSLLLLPVLPLAFADFTFPPLSADQAAVWAFVLIESLAIGVSEELTFRFGLHRLWFRYGATAYVVGSSLLFGALHYPLGMQVSIIAAILGLAFSVARVAGMPLTVLVCLHAFYDAPGVYGSTGLS